MNKIIFTGLSVLSAIALSGCGGGGGGSSIAEDAEVGVGIPVAPAVNGVTSAEAVQRFDNLNNGFINVSSDTSLQTDVPTSGSATYTGDLGFDVSGALPGGGSDVDASLVGDLNLTVNFAPDQNGDQNITGSATNFLYADTEGNFDRPDGTLTIAGGVVPLERDGLPDIEGVISADATGNLTLNQNDGTGDKTVAFDLDLSGQFGGDAGATSADTPTALRGFVIGEGEGDGLILIAPNGRFTGDLPGETIIP